MSEKFLTADQTVCSFFQGVMEPVDIRDESGQLVGRFVPHVSAELLETYEKFKQSLDLENLKRIAEQEKGKGSPLADVWNRIHAREKRA